MREEGKVQQVEVPVHLTILRLVSSQHPTDSPPCPHCPPLLLHTYTHTLMSVDLPAPLAPSTATRELRRT